MRRRRTWARCSAGVERGRAERLQWLEVELGQRRDPLRQRRAQRNAGLDPDEAQIRDVETVEHYQQ
ncbi:MAG: DUF2630 family protein [Actinomycetota bacterium]|nr:DUF2630 family protein [Actinomycetota bacterium]